MPHLLCAAFVLFLIDWLIMIALQTGLSARMMRPAVTAVILLALLSPSAAHAQDAGQAEATRYASELHLAFIRTGVAQIDLTAHAGLEALSNTLTQRTSVEPAGIVAIDPEHDELAFFPVIYWPVVAGPVALSPEAIRNIQSYLDHGGTILFDTRDQQSTAQGGLMSGGANAETLRRLTAGLNIPPLVPMPADHVLTRSFYLMKDFPGRYEGGTIWVEENSASGRDGVSSVIVGNHDWASAWAAGSNGGPRLKGGPQQQEMALRFGVNLVMYALTGNYKADQVHMPHILERLGQ